MSDPVSIPSVAETPPHPPVHRKSLWSNLAMQVFVAMCAGVALGLLAPVWAQRMKPLGDIFIRLIKMVIGPVVFLSLSSGISHIGDLRRVGRIGLKALIYFEVLTTLALGIGFA